MNRTPTHPQWPALLTSSAKPPLGRRLKALESGNEPAVVEVHTHPAPSTDLTTLP
jgi:hypothetical protein